MPTTAPGVNTSTPDQNVTQGSQVPRFIQGDKRDHAGGVTEAEKPAEKTAGESQEREEPGGPLLRLFDQNLPAAEYVEELFELRDVILCELEDSWRCDWGCKVLPLTRWVRAHEDLQGKSAPEAWSVLRRAVERGAKSTDQTPDEWWEWFADVNEDSAEAAFFNWWNKIKSLPTADPVEYAFGLAVESTWTTDPTIAASRPKKYQLFIKFCAHLQFNVGKERAIFLPTRKIGGIFDVTPITISRYCEWAVLDKYLVKVSPGEFHPKGKSLAASYHFELGYFPAVFSLTKRKTS